MPPRRTLLAGCVHLARMPWALLLVSCAGSAPLASSPGASAGPGAEGNVEQVDASGESRAPGSGTSASAGPLPTAPLPGGEAPTPDKALPELRLEPLGMHVGGGKNDADEKAPFHRALERQFPALLECYRLVDDPWTGGSFGVDLKIPREGGGPRVEQPRTKLRGAGFQECMVLAFSKAKFERPKAGPTVISYSVRFTLGRGRP